MIVHVDLFSGGGGFSYALKRAGITPDITLFSEIDLDAIGNYLTVEPGAIFLGPVENVNGYDIRKRYPGAVFILTGGSPCTNFSISGNRKGLEGEESGLFREQIRIIRELGPDIFVWENVRGALASNDRRDFAAILKEFSSLVGYGFFGRLDNSSRSLPQNRPRVYVAGYYGKGSAERYLAVHGATEKPRRKNCLELVPRRQTYRINLADGIAQAITPAKGGGRYFTFDRPIPEDATPQWVLSECEAGRLRIRQLTPIEAERLQGFPDDSTRYAYRMDKAQKVQYNALMKEGMYRLAQQVIMGSRKVELKKGSRFNLAGNAVTVPIARDIIKIALECVQ